MPDADSALTAGSMEGDTAGESNQEQTLAAPPSDSTGLSSAPPTDSESKGSDVVVASSSSQKDIDAADTNDLRDSRDPDASRSGQDSANGTQAETNSGSPLKAPTQQATQMATPNQFAIPAVPASGSANSTPRGRGGGRGGRGRGGLATNGDPAARTADGTPVSGRGRGRGRGGGRPRGSGRGRGGRGGKRKRSDDDDEHDDGNSDSSDEITPIATETRSGRSIQKPTNFVPPPPSPTTNKRKRAYNYRNPQAAVCKVCLRGTSPTSNPVVFCDGCNAPYHRWCHKPPIAQEVIDKEDAEWYCQPCAASRVVPVPMAEVTEFVSVTGASEDQRRKYFAGLPQGMLVTLLTKATTFRPDLPLFDSRFKELVANPQTNGNGGIPSHHSNGGAATVASGSLATTKPPAGQGPSPDDAAYTDDVHPENYPRPGKGLLSTLPPETEDLEWLVDDDDKYGVFTHLYHEPVKEQPVARPSQPAAPPAVASSTSMAPPPPIVSAVTGATTAPTAPAATSNDDGLV
ncbi:putative Zinc finger, PHD-type, Zinc finger, FYVE/PHD-type, Zinc finger, RING/FYVE/PHD-type [Septoria linicola]|nr:putative Zinc finger, PHD-type, Zinc finger, FYVE/PHD-type, Zinc finger, RING/FYVE/PHD-type [Septoria linicola]